MGTAIKRLDERFAGTKIIYHVPFTFTILQRQLMKKQFDTHQQAKWTHEH